MLKLTDAEQSKRDNRSFSKLLPQLCGRTFRVSQGSYILCLPKDVLNSKVGRKRQHNGGESIEKYLGTCVLLNCPIVGVKQARNFFGSTPFQTRQCANFF